MLCLTDPERKREYDESRGRVVVDIGPEGGRRSLGQILVDRKVITREQLKEAESFADARGLSLRDAVVQMKRCDAATAAQALADELGRPFLDLADVIPDDSVLDVMPRSTVKRHTALPLFVDDETVLVACVDEPTHELEDEVRLRFGLPIRAVIATPLAINQGIAKYYAAGMRDESVAEEALKKSGGQGSSPKTAKSGTKKGKSRAPRKPFRELTDEEQHTLKQVGYIIMCWAIVGSVFIDQFFLKGRFIPVFKGAFFPFDQFLLTLFVPAIAIWWVIKVYWK